MVRNRRFIQFTSGFCTTFDYTQVRRGAIPCRGITSAPPLPLPAVGETCGRHGTPPEDDISRFRDKILVSVESDERLCLATPLPPVFT